MKKYLIGTTVLALSLLTACTNEEPKDVEKEETSVEVTESTKTGTETVETNKEDSKTSTSISGLEDLTDDQVSAAEKAVEVFLLNMEATETENMELYSSTIISNLVEVSKESIEPVFEQFDLTYSVVGDIEVVSVSKDLSRVEIKVTQDTLKAEPNQPFTDNRLTATHTLVLEDGDYRISGSVIDPLTVEYLEDVQELIKNSTSGTGGVELEVVTGEEGSKDAESSNK